jgi:hypothetical protein
MVAQFTMTLPLNNKLYHGLQVSPETKAFLDCIVNPLDCQTPAQVPDIYTGSTVCMTDWTDTISPVNTSVLVPAGGLFMVQVSGSCDMRGIWPVAFGAERWYGVYGWYFDSNGVAISDALFATQPVNENFIDGVDPTTATPVNLDAAFMAAGRVFGMGFRVLPTVEMVTDTTVNYLQFIVGGQLTPGEIFDAYNDGSLIFDMVKNSRGSQMYANNQGVCVRYDPFQREDQLEMMGTDKIMTTDRPVDGLHFPCVAIKFKDLIAPGSVASAPLTIADRYWIEAVPKQPTPIYAQRSPTDLLYPQLRMLMAGGCERHPLVTKGHSFASFVSAAPSFLRTVAGVLQGTSSIGKAVGGVVRMFKGKKKKKKKKGGGGRKGGKRLPGATLNVKARKPVRNLPKRKR